MTITGAADIGNLTIFKLLRRANSPLAMQSLPSELSRRSITCFGAARYPSLQLAENRSTFSHARRILNARDFSAASDTGLLIRVKVDHRTMTQTPSKDMTQEEHVLVVPTALIEDLGMFEGFQADTRRYLQPILESDQLSFQPRSAMEQDPSFKQLIPYVILQWTDSSGTLHLFRYTRGSGQGEKRLHAKKSLGVGGHISSEDAAGGDDWYRTGMLRELNEELIIDTTYDESHAGLIYDPSNPVGEVHLGVVHQFTLAGPKVRNRESELVDSGFARLDEIRADRDSLETWSQLCLDQLYPIS